MGNLIGEVGKHAELLSKLGLSHGQIFRWRGSWKYCVEKLSTSRGCPLHAAYIIRPSVALRQDLGPYIVLVF